MDLSGPSREKLNGRENGRVSEQSTGSVVQHLSTLNVDTLKMEYWSEFCDQESPNILDDDGLCIATDGGVSDIDELHYSMQYFYAGLLVAFCLANVYMISLADMTALLVQADAETAKASSKFLLSKSLVAVFFPDTTFHLNLAIPLMELLYLWGLVSQILLRCLSVALAKKQASDDSDPRVFARWSSISEICWSLAPQLSSFSAMRLLYYVTPSVVGTQAFMQYGNFNLQRKAAHGCMDNLHAFWGLLRYVLQLAFCLVIGLDAFLVKYRMAAHFINEDSLGFNNMLGTSIFLFQVLGIVNLNWFVRERLFVFIFGGEDGSVDHKEKARWHVWNALLAKRIYERFGFFKGTVVMLGFDDYDFQLLVLDDAEKEVKMAQKKKGVQVQPAFNRTMVRNLSEKNAHESRHPSSIEEVPSPSRPRPGSEWSDAKAEVHSVLAQGATALVDKSETSPPRVASVADNGSPAGAAATPAARPPETTQTPAHADNRTAVASVPPLPIGADNGTAAAGIAVSPTRHPASVSPDGADAAGMPPLDLRPREVTRLDVAWQQHVDRLLAQPPRESSTSPGRTNGSVASGIGSPSSPRLAAASPRYIGASPRQAAAREVAARAAELDLAEKWRKVAELEALTRSLQGIGIGSPKDGSSSAAAAAAAAEPPGSDEAV